MRGDDTTFICRVALEDGLHAVLIPNRVVVVHGSAGGGVAFARGVPPSTDQGTAAILEEQDVTRSILSSKGIPVPRSRTHTFRQRDSIANAMAEFGGRVLLRPAWQASREFVATDDRQLWSNVERLRASAGRHVSRLNRPQSRLMLEEITQPVNHGLLVSHGKVLSRPAGLTAKERSLAVNAVSAFPGLEVATVKLATRQSDGEVLVVSLSHYPRLRLFGEQALELARSVVATEVANAGGELPTRRPEGGRVQITIDGVPDPERWTESMQKAPIQTVIREVEVAGDGRIRARLEGESLEAAALVDSIMAGKVSGSLPLRIEIVPDLG